MTYQAKDFEVRSDRDNGVVFPKETVRHEARVRGVSTEKAARQLAAENADEGIGEMLFTVRAE